MIKSDPYHFVINRNLKSRSGRQQQIDTLINRGKVSQNKERRS